MSDLLNYSIMQPRSPVSPNVSSSSFSSPKLSFNAPPQTTVLPPINTLIQSALPSPHQQHSHHQPQQASSSIKLPPISPSNYTLARPNLPSSTSVCAQLTETNLSQFQSNRDSHGLGLLSSAIFLDQQQQQQHQQQTQPQQFQSSSRSSSVPSLVSSVSSVVSYMSSPATPVIVHANVQPQQPQQPANISTPKPNTTSTSSSSSSSPTNKRRQRLGPSCDSCRARKVKCDAEITILSTSTSTSSIAATYNLNSQQLHTLSTTNKLCMGDFQLLHNNNKYIHFKPCRSCIGKKIDCCFSSGFTKEDILSNKKKSKKSTSLGGSSSCGGAGKVSKETTKRSSVAKNANANGICLDKLLNCGALTEAQVGITA
ncbi:hypothetical protein FOB58_003839 [Candida parapsilosis]|uniref:Zn(2)-C6 fungal-type domain-containing protein n=2 Tax=Candida parapsilosis TaxID=5480 RepID=G8B9G7_CANPC|nr:uncharacterized protein CPAR2_302555 [Candida parapsilosis]KAF6044201.1 hypothetical protein FOB60_005294 [Candida parapsilosis]KAF6047761.1 hypothetical protein FOB58_003839 [Candida parapsilosis]KAF6050271.1 hypothetical protein FOB59_002517 [Candida parapsilosis]KAF6061391.1 hypothetical protein FOB61_004148 [Candida parapsilosis]KAI5904206.1 hypothetical protein K4G60_g3364 [Candida parapsilosis]